MNTLTYNEIVHAVNSDILTEAVKFQKYDTMFDMVLMKEYNLCAEAQCKVYSEGGDSTDLDYLYTEAKKAVAAEKKGVLAHIWEVITGIIKKITGFIGGIFGVKGVDDNTTVPVEKKYSDIKVIEIVQRLFDNIPKPIKDAASLATAAAGVVAAGFEMKAYLDKFTGKSETDPISVKIIKSIIEKVKEIIGKITDFIKNLREVEEDDSIDTVDDKVEGKDQKKIEQDKSKDFTRDEEAKKKGTYDVYVTDPKRIDALVAERNSKIKDNEYWMSMASKEDTAEAKEKVKKYKEEINKLKQEVSDLKAGKFKKSVFERVLVDEDGVMFTEASVTDKAREFLGKSKTVVIRTIATVLNKMVQFFQGMVGMFSNLITKAAKGVAGGASKVVGSAKDAIDKAKSKFRKDETEDVTESAWDFDLELFR